MYFPSMRFTFLGTGTSHGVPQIDCMLQDYARCPKNVCRESVDDPRHCRTRSSILLHVHDKRILIDVSPDFRQQALAERIPGIDAVLITHCHADHIGGMPDIRSYTRDSALPVFGTPESMERIREAYRYIFEPPPIVGGGIPQLTLTAIDEPFDLFQQQVIPLPVEHGSLQGCVGYRIGPLAYLPDLKSLTAEALSRLKGVQCLILDCLRESPPHPTHIILPESIRIARDISPAKCYFTHFCHDIHYRKDAHHLDPWMSFAYDGLTVEVSENGSVQEPIH